MSCKPPLSLILAGSIRGSTGPCGERTMMSWFVDGRSAVAGDARQSRLPDPIREVPTYRLAGVCAGSGASAAATVEGGVLQVRPSVNEGAPGAVARESSAIKLPEEALSTLDRAMWN